MERLGRLAVCVAVATAIVSRGELRAVEVLGVGTGALLGNDLTDLGNDGVEGLYAPPADWGGFDATFFSSDEPTFGTGEAAFNAFDNLVGGGDDKWCCGTVFPQTVGADFTETQGVAFRLTHFTVASANDSPERDPVVWRIDGSNDGECWTTVFSPTDLAVAVEALGRGAGSAIWSDRLQVIRFDEGIDYDVQDVGYSMFRMVTTQTGATTGAFFQIGEIELFGEEADPPDECFYCSGPVVDVVCEVGGAGQSLPVSWTIPADCNCGDPTAILVNGVEVGSVAPDATSFTIPAASLPAEVFVVAVLNCSGSLGTCAPFKTTADGSIVGTSWLALGPFATTVGCDGNASLFLTNHIGPEETIGCQYPAEGDPVEGYVPGVSGVEDPAAASTTGYHALAPTDEFGNPVWRLFSDATPADGILNFEQGPAGALDEHMQFVATWVENKTASAIRLRACIGRDDDAQVWVDDGIVHNQATCTAFTQCATRFSFSLPSGIHVITIGVWEQAGDWQMAFGLHDPETDLPVIDLGGILDVAQVTGASPLSDDIVFHGTERPASFVEPDCSGMVCLPVTNLSCTKDADGTIDLTWENAEGCEGDIRILAGTEEVAVVAPGTTSYTIDEDTYDLAAMVSVDNGSYAPAQCTLVETLAALVGGDLTDADDVHAEASYAPPANYGGFDATFFSSDEPTFDATEAAFNVFDNLLGGGNNKWCCGTSFPQIVGADFTETQGTAYRLTHFTVTSAEDAPDRDPRVWRLEGSNDGTTWTTIFSQDNPDGALWTARQQVLLFQEGREFEVQEEAYSMFRMVTEQTNLPGGDPLTAFFQVGEIELFGEESGTTPEICDNGIDDDGDQLTDCADPSCAQNAACAKRFERGDADGEGSINITDGIFILNFLFLGGADPGCADAADTNDDGSVNITDGIYVLNFLFLGGGEPPAPYGVCGTDPTEDDTGCLTPHTQGQCAP